MLKLVNITFTSIKKAFESRDHVLLRQLVEFYIDVKKQNPDEQNEELAEIYEREVKDLLEVCKCGCVSYFSINFNLDRCYKEPWLQRAQKRAKEIFTIWGNA